MGLVCTIRNRGERTETRSRVKKRNIYRYIPRADLRRLRSFAQLTGFFAFSYLDAKLRILAVRSTFTGHRRPPGIREKPGRQRDTLFELVSGQSCVLSNTFFFFALLRARAFSQILDRSIQVFIIANTKQNHDYKTNHDRCSRLVTSLK